MRQRGNVTSRSAGSSSLSKLTARIANEEASKPVVRPFPPPNFQSLIVSCGSNAFGQVFSTETDILCTTLKPTLLPVGVDDSVHVVAIAAGPQLSAAILSTEVAEILPVSVGTTTDQEKEAEVETYVNISVTNTLYLWGSGLVGQTFRQPTAITIPTAGKSSGTKLAVDEGICAESSAKQSIVHPLSGSINRTLRGVVQVSCGQAHIGVITVEGHVFTWGDGGDGRLGHGNRTSISSPKLLTALGPLRALSLSCGAFHTAIIACDRSIAAEGRHRIRIPATATTPFSASSSSSKASSRASSRRRPRLDDLIEEENEDEDEEEEEDRRQADVEACMKGDDDGRMERVGSKGSGVPDNSGNGGGNGGGNSNINHGNGINDGARTADSADSSARPDDTVLLCGDLYVCGLGKAGQLGLGAGRGSTRGGSAAAGGGSVVVVPTRVSKFDSEQDLQGNVGYKVAQVSCGMHHTLMLCVPVSSLQSRGRTREGSSRPSSSDTGAFPESHIFETAVFSCGYNEHGRLGLGDDEKRDIPTRITFPALDHGMGGGGVSKSFYGSFNTSDGGKEFFHSGVAHTVPFAATDVSAGDQHSLVAGNGCCFSFGSNEYGQCGIGSPNTTEMALTPSVIPIPEGIQVRTIHAGGRHSAAITTCGKTLLFGWGEDAQCTQSEKNVYWPRPARIPRFERSKPEGEGRADGRGGRVGHKAGGKDGADEKDAEGRKGDGEADGAKMGRCLTTRPVAIALGTSHTMVVVQNMDYLRPPPKAPPVPLPMAVFPPPVVPEEFFLPLGGESFPPRLDVPVTSSLIGGRKSKNAVMAGDDDDAENDEEWSQGDLKAVRGIRELLGMQRKETEEFDFASPPNQAESKEEGETEGEVDVEAEEEDGEAEEEVVDERQPSPSPSPRREQASFSFFVTEEDAY